MVGSAAHSAASSVIPMDLDSIAVLLPVLLAVSTVATAYTIGRGIGTNLSGLAAAWLLALVPGHVAATGAGSFDGGAAGPLLVALAVWRWGAAVRHGSVRDSAAVACWLWVLAVTWAQGVRIVLEVIVGHVAVQAVAGRPLENGVRLLTAVAILSAALITATAVVCPSVAHDLRVPALVEKSRESPGMAWMDSGRQASAWSSLYVDTSCSFSLTRHQLFLLCLRGNGGGGVGVQVL